MSARDQAASPYELSPAGRAERRFETLRATWHDPVWDWAGTDAWRTPRGFVDRALREVTRGTLYENDRAIERRTCTEPKPLEIRARVSLATLLSLNG